MERRADRADVVDSLTDVYIENDSHPKPPTVRKGHAAANLDELRVLEPDHVVLKPRIDPFIGTDLRAPIKTLVPGLRARVA